MRTQNVESVYELSPLQQGILLHTLSDPSPGMYFEQFSSGVAAALNAVALKQACQLVVDRHPALRTSFHWEGIDKPLQIVHRHVDLEFDEQDWTAVAAADREAKLLAYLADDRR